MPRKRRGSSDGGSFDFLTGRVEGTGSDAETSGPSRPTATRQLKAGSLMTKSADDTLREVSDAVAAWAKELTVPVLHGILEKDAPVPVCFAEVNSEADVAPLLATAGELKPSVVLLSFTELAVEDVDDVLADRRDRGANAAEIAAVESVRPFVGSVATVAVDIFVATGGMVLRFALAADWYDELYTRPVSAESDGGRDPEWQAQEDERKRWTREKKREVARQVASDSRFPKCKTEQARIYLLREVLASEAPENDVILKDIAREAKVIYDFEIKQDGAAN